MESRLLNLKNKILNNKKNIKIDSLENISGDIEFKYNFILMLIDADYASRTINQTLTMFRNIAQLENNFRKDVFNFNIEQTKGALKYLKKPSINSLAAEKVLLDKYLLYAFENNMVKSAIHPSFNIKARNFDEFINTNARNNKYITKKEYLSIIKSAINAQDQAFLIFLWKALYNKNLNLIRHIRKRDINFEKKYLLIDYTNPDTGEFINKIIYLDDYELDIMKRAIEQSIYIEGNDGNKTFTLNTDSEYILSGNKIDDKTISKFSLTGRFRNIFLVLNNSHIKIKSLYTSGAFYKVLEDNPGIENNKAEYLKKMLEYKIARDTANSVLSVIKEKESLEN